MGHPENLFILVCGADAEAEVAFEGGVPGFVVAGVQRDPFFASSAHFEAL
jgi:hypothetical protein